MKINSQELIQSYVLTTAKYDFSVYEKRILYRLIELAQADMQGKKLDTGYIISETLFKDKIIKMPLRAFMKENEQNHSRIKKALTDLRNKTIEYDDGDHWRLIGIIEKPNFTKSAGFVEFEIQPMIWEAILNFTKGFSKYELETAMKFESVYAMRFYELFSNNLQPLTFSIEDLKERFGIAEKYKDRPMDFVRRVVIRAKQELDEKAPYSFNFTTLKTGRKVTTIKFIPYKTNNPELIEKSKLNQKMSLRWDFAPGFLSRLKKYGFDDKGIKANRELFKEFLEKIDEWDDFLDKVATTAQNSGNPPGYIIGAMRNYLKNLKNVDIQQVNMLDEIANRIAKQKKIN